MGKPQEKPHKFDIGEGYGIWEMDGEDRFLAALLEVDRARDSIQLAHDALDEIQD